MIRICHRTMNFATDFGKETDIIISRIEAKTTIPAHNNKNLSSDDEFCDGFRQNALCHICSSHIKNTCKGISDKSSGDGFYKKPISLPVSTQKPLYLPAIIRICHRATDFAMDCGKTRADNSIHIFKRGLSEDAQKARTMAGSHCCGQVSVKRRARGRVRSVAGRYTTKSRALGQVRMVAGRYTPNACNFLY